ncbi:amidoligase family protein [Ruminococcaceae bacterium OttesenSCG-928-L11]|nr:amidoligase family protein [Ruminococcaceae bacterium OttesenSCG-928-L11]
MLSAKFGIEIEFTGITRQRAAEVAAEVLGGTRNGERVTAPDRRVWKFVSDGSIRVESRRGRQAQAVELVSPILTYREDIDTLQKLIRALREAGGRANSSCGIHIHLNGANHDVRSIRNFINIIAARNDLFYKALQIEPDRMRYCKKMDAMLVGKMNQRKPRTLEQVRKIWYEGYAGNQSNHYHQSRYHFLNLHSFFNGHGTVELRGFNSTLHAGKIRAYIVLALALNHQALTQKSARPAKCQMENEKFAMRVYLNRIGFIGEEFANCREHLYMHLAGNAAWRYREPAPRRTTPSPVRT